MSPTFNQADIRINSDGLKYLDLEIQVIADDQVIKFRYTLPATSNLQSQHGKQAAEGSNQ